MTRMAVAIGPFLIPLLLTLFFITYAPAIIDDARYLAAGPVVNGARLWQPLIGPADMVVVRVGVSVGLR